MICFTLDLTSDKIIDNNLAMLQITDDTKIDYYMFHNFMELIQHPEVDADGNIWK